MEFIGYLINKKGNGTVISNDDDEEQKANA